MPNIQGPDGKVIAFPEGTSDADIASAFSSMPTPPVNMSSVAGAGPMGLPQPAAHPSVDMQESSIPGAMTRLLGDRPVANSATVVGQHLKNFAVNAATTIAAPPSGAQEQVANALGPGGLQLDRAFVQPTVNALREAGAQYKAGNIAGAPYGADNKYKPSVVSSIEDAIPIAGPWARNIANDAQMYGAVPAALGAGTDIAAPKIAGGLFSGAANLTGKAMQAAASTPEALKIAATRGLVTGTPGEMLNRSLKPPVTMPDFEQSVEASLPSIAAQNPQGVSGFAQAAEVGKNAEQTWYKGLTDPFRTFKADASPIADAQMRSIPITDRIEKPATPAPIRTKLFGVSDGDGGKMNMGAQVGGDEQGGIVNKTAEKANNYRRPLPLGVIDDVRKDTGAKSQAFFNKAGGDRYAAMSDPETARVVATNDASRNIAYDNFSRLSAAGRTDGGVPVSDIAANQNLYGHLSDVSDVAGKRATVAGRANPLSLQESLALHGNPITQAYNFGTSRLFKGLTDSDAVTNAAVDRYKNPGGITLPPRPTPFARGLSAAGSTVVDASKLSPFKATFIAGQTRKRGLFDR